MSTGVPRPRPPSTRALVEELAQGDPAEAISLGELLDRFDERSFGMFVLLVLLPCFIPIPMGQGGLCGVLIALIGLQFLTGLHHPWLPRFLARRPVHRHTLVTFRNRMGRWLERIERLTRPRTGAVLENPFAHAFTGLMLVVLGILLALPLPLTNYPFGMVLLVYALALIERDGRAMLVAWALGLVEIGIVAGFSGQIVAWTRSLLA